MDNISLHQGYNHPLLDRTVQRLANADIRLHITKKRVKNINFRLKPYQLVVSVPASISNTELAQAVERRVPWALTHHPQVLKRHQRLSKEIAAQDNFLLWGEVQAHTLNQQEKFDYYRQQLTLVMPKLFAKWQPIVGAYAQETRIKKMQTRWGSCNTRARRIWLSVHLPAYPIECTEYVIVHELCHLHHANHSPAFWQTVAAAMPDYRHWHDMLAGKSGKLD